jgi:Cu-processing system ATP-binding protein
MKVVLRDLAVRFGSVQALAGVDLDLEPGQVTVLAGPNGAGKTTCLSVVLGLVQPDEGQVEVDGVPLVRGWTGLPRTFLARVGYLPESVAFAQNLSGGQALRFHGWSRGVGTATQVATLARVGLSHAAHRPVRGYSRGMLQRLGLAVAILHNPELLVLDEPTGGLDQQGLDVLWRVLAERRAAGQATVACTHDLTLIERHADHLVVFSEGRVKASGTPEALRNAVALPVVVALEFKEESAARDWAVETRIVKELRVQIDGARVRTEVPSDRLLPLMEALPTTPGVVQQLRVEEPGLDQVYQALLEKEGPWSASSAR